MFVQLFMQACTVYVLMEHTPLGDLIDAGGEACGNVLVQASTFVKNQFSKKEKGED